MKRFSLFSLVFFLVGVLSAQDSSAQDYTRLGLPDGALARLGKGSIGEGDRAVAWSHDGTLLAVASSIGIWLYDTDTGAEVVLLTGHAAVRSVAFSPDGQTLASGSWDGMIRLWDVDTRQEKASPHRTYVFGHFGGVFA